MLFEWIEWVRACFLAYAGIIWALSVLSVIMLVISIAFVPLLIRRIPVDHYVRSTQPIGDHRSSQAHLLLRCLRNLVGLILLVAGIAMLFLPGQGLLTILVALGLLDFPGKRRVEIALLRSPGLAQLVQWIRRRAGVPPLRLSPLPSSDDK